MDSLKEVVNAITDLTRVTIALSGKFETKADAVRRLSELAIPQTRIAAILAIEAKHVASILSKDKKRLSREEVSPDVS